MIQCVKSFRKPVWHVLELGHRQAGFLKRLRCKMAANKEQDPYYSMYVLIWKLYIGKPNDFFFCCTPWIHFYECIYGQYVKLIPIQNSRIKPNVSHWTFQAQMFWELAFWDVTKVSDNTAIWGCHQTCRRLSRISAARQKRQSIKRVFGTSCSLLPLQLLSRLTVLSLDFHVNLFLAHLWSALPNSFTETSLSTKLPALSIPSSGLESCSWVWIVDMIVRCRRDQH